MNTLVRVCAATYDKAPVEQEGIQVLVSMYIIKGRETLTTEILCKVSQRPQ